MLAKAFHSKVDDLVHFVMMSYHQYMRYSAEQESVMMVEIMHFGTRLYTLAGNKDYRSEIGLDVSVRLAIFSSNSSISPLLQASL